MKVTERLEKNAQDLEPALAAAIEGLPSVPRRLREAMAHALLGGGKRLRPSLALAACELAGGRRAEGLPGAVALECLHSYSLVHDDLPCMDDDELRRGRPTVHKAFGEAMAVLAGDALLTLAFESLAKGPAPADRKMKALRLLAEAGGAAGMVGGQALDLEAEGGEPELKEVEEIHRRKTGALIEAALGVGALLGGGAPHLVESLRSYGRALGLAFQIVDDCLDQTRSAAELGKTAGKDEEAGKATWVACLGVEESMRQARALVSEAISALESLPGSHPQVDFLKELAFFVVSRGY
ncbi:MAG TPA: polyprenyl synthetase family protein [Planctomycetes bacterium]|nr:polyprenyl synthetase family protein [Planctomycetota bacterium]